MRKKLLRASAIFWSLLLAAQFTFAQSRVVTGIVRDNDGRPRSGVTVKSGTYTATTNEKGTYEITVADQEDVLSFSSLGVQSQQISVNNRSTIDAVLLSTSIDLDDVVVVGYGGVRKSDLAGAVATLKGSDLNKTPASSVDQLLQGKIPGVQVAISSGQPGAGATVRIRGNSSLSGSNAPLVV